MDVPVVEMRLPADQAPKRVRHGFRLYVGRPGETIEVHRDDADLMLRNGFELAGDIAALSALSAAEVIDYLRSGALDPDEAELAERARPRGVRVTVIEAIAARRAADNESVDDDDAES